MRSDEEGLRKENERLRSELHALRDFVPDEDGALRLRSEPNGPAYCQVCFQHQRCKIRLVLEQNDAVYYCQACDKRWIRRSQASRYLKSFQDAGMGEKEPPVW